jgi:hypothetical protein
MNTVNIGGPGMFHCARFSSSSSEGIATVEVKTEKEEEAVQLIEKYPNFIRLAFASLRKMTITPQDLENVYNQNSDKLQDELLALIKQCQ